MHSVVVALYFILQNELQALPTVNKVTMNSIFEMHPDHAPIWSRYCQSAQDTICVVVAIDYFSIIGQKLVPNITALHVAKPRYQ